MPAPHQRGGAEPHEQRGDDERLEEQPACGGEEHDQKREKARHVRLPRCLEYCTKTLIQVKFGAREPASQNSRAATKMAIIRKPSATLTAVPMANPIVAATPARPACRQSRDAVSSPMTAPTN